ncbi:hypothetical protein [Methylobacterium radiodurans]|uniref:Uncharacterized protein n=1 Tax=Methylobacterium radiodurans TaxID=2202828 RepID=A0A2U8VSU1_9HYPH|nr:hypothetical protein [Methylobacterium radiodurans]AWN36757.1 hypothetical protein DK427_14290 [Methylobacterium radiodurans]
MLAAGCVLLIGPAEARDEAQPLKVHVTGSIDPGQTEEDLDLGGGLIELLLTGSIRPRHRSPPDQASIAAPPAQPAPQPPVPKLIAYDGDLPKGTVIVNETRSEVYRVVGRGRAELYRPGGDVLGLAKLLVPR